jgi:hypothetical protein
MGRQDYGPNANAYVPVAAAERVQGYLHHGGGVPHHSLDFIPYGTLENRLFRVGQLKAGELVEQGRYTVLVTGASALIDGHDEHLSTIGG